MKNTMFVLAPGVIIEDLGSDSAVFVPGVAEVLTLSGDAAAVIRRIRSGESVEGAEAVVSDLVARGVIQPAHGMSRRGVVRAGVIGAGAGIAALAMPGVAAAASTGGGSSGGVFGRTDWFTESAGTTFLIASRLGSPPWGSGYVPSSPATAGNIPAGFTQPSALTVPGAASLPFLRLINQNPGTETFAVWDRTGSPWTPTNGQIVSFEVNSVVYEVEVLL